MAEAVVMPQAGNTVESCILVSWNVAVGDTVEASTVICEAETDKSTVDVEAGASGTVLALLADEGDEVPVKDPILVLGAEGDNAEAALKELGIEPATTGEAGEVEESDDDDLTPEASESRPVKESAEPAPAPARERTFGQSSGAASPRARRAAQHKGVDLSGLSGSGPGGRIIEDDVLDAAASSPGTTVGARATGQGAPDTPGTGIGGRHTRADLDAAAARPAPAVVSGAATREYPGPVSETPLKGVRAIIAERMMHALASTAPVTYNVSARAEGLLGLRKRFKNSPEELGYSRITIGDLVCYATVQTLRRHGALNAHLEDNTLTTFQSVHLGLAVDTPRGLLVPTIRNADAMGLREFSQTSYDLAQQAIGGKIDPDLLGGATFTVSNLGSFGMESFTPIINVPQTAILGVNTITPRAEADADGEVRLTQRIGFSLTADHRAIDGADAARFLKDLVAAIENIELTVIG
ncbi:MAG: dihydrolipoamide acetyltransferase family protein [Bowdeniella nasicola]|nr:dihydrolipoamide acetyltransferase family protein [Bowdeniella nasicola]